MFSKLALFTAATMAVFVAAAPSGGMSDSCNTGTVQCCNSTHESSSHEVSGLLSLLGLSLGDITGKVGLQCSPIGVLGVSGGSSCTQQPVCCSNNSFNGLVAIGCTPINIGL